MQDETALNLFAAVQARVDRFASSQDDAVVLAPEAAVEAEQLEYLAIAIDGGRVRMNLTAIRLLGWFYWFRYTSLPAGQDDRDLGQARRLFSVVRERHPNPLPEAITAILDRAVAPDSEEKFASWWAAGTEDRSRFSVTGDPMALERAVNLLRRASSSIPRDEFRSVVYSELTGALRAHFGRTGHLPSLDEAVDAGRVTVRALGSGAPEQPIALSNLSTVLQIRFEKTSDPTDIEEAVQASRDAVAHELGGDDRCAQHLATLSTGLYRRSKSIASDADLDEAVETAQHAVDLTSAADPAARSRYNNLGALLLTRFKRDRTWLDLDRAVEAFTALLSSTPLENPISAAAAGDLVKALRTRFAHHDNRADIDRAVALATRVVHETSDSDPLFAVRHTALATVVFDRFDRYGNLTDLDQSIQAIELAIAATTPTDPDHGLRLSLLADSLRIRGERSASRVDLDRAVALARDACTVGRDGDLHPMQLSSLAATLASRFRQFNTDLTDLEAATELSRQAVRDCSAEDPAWAGIQSTLAAILKERFERWGNLADLDQAIQAILRATNNRSRDPIILANLGAVLLGRFARTGQPSDLQDAVTTIGDAVTATPSNHPARAVFLLNFASASRRRFTELGDLDDLNRAIDACRQAIPVAVTSTDQAGMLATLVNTLADRFETTADPTDLDAAIEYGRQAIALPASPDLHATALSGLSRVLLSHSETTGEATTLDEAITLARRAANAVAVGHPQHAHYLFRLGDALRSRSTGDHDGDIAEIETCWRAAFMSPTARAEVRLRAASQYGILLHQVGRTAAAALGYEIAVGLLPVLTWRGLPRTFREQQIAQWVGLACDSAAAQLDIERPVSSLELLEQGRSVLWGQQLQLRGDLSGLRKAAPELYSQLDAIRSELDAWEFYIPPTVQVRFDQPEL